MRNNFSHQIESQKSPPREGEGLKKKEKKRKKKKKRGEKRRKEKKRKENKGKGKKNFFSLSGVAPG